MKVKLIFAWYDLWVGFFWDKKKSWLYIFPLPTLGVILKFKKKVGQEVTIVCNIKDVHRVVDHPVDCLCPKCLSDHMKSQLKNIEKKEDVIMKCTPGNHRFVSISANILECTICGKKVIG